MPIRTKLIAIFLAFVIVPTVFVLALFFSNAEDVLKDELTGRLEGIADMKKERVETFYKDRLVDLEAIQAYRVIKENLPVIISGSRNKTGPAYVSAYKKLDERMKTVQKIYGYQDIMLTGPEGEVVYVGNEAHRPSCLGRPLPDAGGMVFKKGRTGAHFSEIFGNPLEDGRPSMLVAGPLEDLGGRFIGVAALSIDMQHIYDALQNTRGLMKTGETLIGKRFGDKVHYLNPARHGPGEALKMIVPMGGRKAFPMQEAAQGREGSGLAADYQGDEVIAAWRYIPSLGWGVVTKIDADEAFRPVKDLRNIAVIMGLIILVSGVVAVLLISKTVTEPVSALRRGAEAIGSGDLDYKVGTNAKDEIGELSRAFGRMAENLKKVTASRDELDREIADRRWAEEQLRVQSSLLAATNGVLREALTGESQEDVARTCLAVAEELTGSRFGYIDEINPEGRVDTIALSNPGWEACKMQGSEAPKLPHNLEARGIIGRVIKRGQTQIVNDPASDPDRVGTPEGHPPLRCYMGVPLKQGDKVIGLIGLANKEGGYNPDDQKNIETLSAAFTEALMRRHAEDAIKSMNEELECRVKERTAQLTAANNELEAFCYSVSHDLRSPLRSIDGFSQALVEDFSGKLGEKGIDCLTRVRAASQKMAQLIDDMLKLSRVSRGEMREERVDMSALARSVAAELKAAQPGREVEVVVQDGLFASGDPRLIGVVVENLVGNAWKFTSKRPHARVEFGAAESEAGTAFFVRDDGAGFDMAYKEKLFGPFQRLHSTADFSGTGIGLATVQRIVARHGGRVWAKGEVGKGAIFYFTLGREEPAQNEEAA